MNAISIRRMRLTTRLLGIIYGVFIASSSSHKQLRPPSDAASPRVSSPYYSALQSFPPKDNTIEAWSSAYQVDCERIATSLTNQPETGVFKQTTTKVPFLMNLHDPARDMGVSKAIFNNGCFECDFLDNMLKALSKYPNSYFLDIGGNIGMWSLTAASAGHQTFTIEALSTNINRFCKSVDKNDLYNTTHLMNIAATSKPEMLTLDFDNGNFGGTSIQSGSTSNLAINGIYVEGVPIDSLDLPTDGYSVVLKIDVEGHELHALLGALNFLKDANIVYAFTELRPHLDGDATSSMQWKSIFDILASKGLKPYRKNYDDETLLDVEKLGTWRHFKHQIMKYYNVEWRLDDWETNT